jgi:hypothetical protein
VMQENGENARRAAVRYSSTILPVACTDAADHCDLCACAGLSLPELGARAYGTGSAPWRWRPPRRRLPRQRRGGAYLFVGMGELIGSLLGSSVMRGAARCWSSSRPHGSGVPAQRCCAPPTASTAASAPGGRVEPSRSESRTIDGPYRAARSPLGWRGFPSVVKMPPSGMMVGAGERGLRGQRAGGAGRRH